MIDSLSLTNIIIVVVSLIVSLTLHEAMHAYTGYLLGDDTAKVEGRVTLNPLRHIDPFATVLLPLITLVIFKVPILAAKPVPFNPDRVKHDEFGAAMIAASGPITNLILAFLAGGLISLFQGNLGADLLQILSIFIIINVGLFVFNMIPIPPLDGSRVLYAFAPESVQRFMVSIETVGIFIVFGLVLLVPQFSDLLVSINQKVLNLVL